MFKRVLILGFLLVCGVYRNDLKNWIYDKEALRNFHPERETIVREQGSSEDGNFEAKPTPSETNSSNHFGIWGKMEAYLIDEKANPQPALLELLQLFQVSHEGTLDSIVRATQSAWYQGGKERWELDERYPGKMEQAYPLLRKLGCIDPLFAKKKRYDYALLLGGHVSRMKRRIALLIDEWNRGVRFDKLILLTGARPLDESEKMSCATETEALLALLKLPIEMRKIPCQLIDTPMQSAKGGGTRRPNTADTLMTWLLTKPSPGSCIAFGDQPFVGYFESVLKTFLPNSFSVEVIGQESLPYPLALFLDNLARWLYQEQLYHSRKIMP